MEQQGYVPRYAPKLPPEYANEAYSYSPLVVSRPCKPCGFWRRFKALIEDFIILGIVGGVLGYFMIDVLIGLGTWGRLIGFVIALFYFGLLNGPYGNGQTLGKRWRKIKVVDGDGRPISYARSFGRFAVIGFPLCISGLFNSVTGTIFDIFISFLSVLGTILFLALLYFLLFNRRNRRLLHDEIFDTYVVPVESIGEVTLPRTWPGHWVFASVLCLGITGVMFLLGLFAVALLANSANYSELNELRNAVLSIEGVQDAGAFVQAGAFYSTGGTYVAHPQLKITVLWDSRVDDFEEVARKIMPVVLQKVPANLNQGDLIVIIQYGFDIWIANYSRSGWEAMKSKEWASWIRQPDQNVDFKTTWSFDSITITEMD